MLKPKLNKKQCLTIIITVLVIITTVFSIVVFNSQNFDHFANSFKSATNYRMNLTFDEKKNELSGNQTVEYKNNTKSNLDCLKFHLYPNNFSSESVNKPVSSLYEGSAYPNGKSYGFITIKSVLVNDEEWKFSLTGTDKDILEIPFETNLKKDYFAKIFIEYTVVLPNINHRFGYGNNTVNLGNFYPILCVYENGKYIEDYYTASGDPFYSDISNYYVNITYPNSYTLASSGIKLNETENNESKNAYIEGRGIRDFAMVFSNKFNIKSATVDNTTINYYYYNDKNPDNSLQTCIDSLTTFNDMIGEYSYRTLNVVESNFVYGGMEYPNLVLISDNLDKYEDYTNTIVHEIAHQWFYGMIGNNQYNSGWIDEGLSEYVTNYFYKLNPSYGVNYDEVVSNAQSAYNLFVEIFSSVYGKVDTSMNRNLNEYATEPEYVYMAYVKGMLLFDNLKCTLSEKTFNKCLKNFFKTYKGKTVTQENLVSSFEKTSHIKLKEFFDSWIEGKVEVVPID